MTSTTRGTAPPVVAAKTITVACITSGLDLAAALRTRLAAANDVSRLTTVGWRVVDVPDLPPDAPADIAVCDGPTATATAQRRWPTAAVLTLVPDRDDGQAVIAALESGAQACVRGLDPTLIAAFVAALARRRGLLATDRAR